MSSILVDEKFSPYAYGVRQASVVVGAESANTILATVTLKDNLGVALADQFAVFAFLSDDAAGNVIAASAPDSGWAITTSGLLIPVVANKAAYFVCTSAGVFAVTVSESTAKTFYLQIVLPTGKLVTTAIAFA